MSDPESGRLLIADDEVAQVTALVRTLQEEGYAVTGTHSAQEALSALRSQRFDILVTDLMMPDMDGVALLRAAQAIEPDLVGIVMTGHGTIDTAVEAMKNGALDYILKPFRLTAMLPVLSRALTVRRLRLENAALLQRLADRTTELEAMNRELRSANRELEAFSSTVSHDLRQPLNVILGFAELLLSEGPGVLNSKQKEYLRDIHGGGRRLFQLTDDLLRFSRLGRDSLTLEHVDVLTLVQSVVADLRATEDGREAVIRVGPMPNATADPALLKQVFTNLLSNAIKFRLPNGPALIEISGWQESGQCAYSVRDNGIGFDMKHAERLFGLFQRLPDTEQVEGNGVGLSITQRIVERHGGRIFAEAEKGKGARFTFTLPVAQEATGERADREATTKQT
ncbi:MAG: sensor histidine kinase [Steroidobacteraceae bacterium]